MWPALDARVSVRPFAPSDEPSPAAILGSTCAGIVSLDAQWRVTSSNAAAASIFARPSEECLGVEFPSLLTSAARGEWTEQVAPVVAGGEATFESEIAVSSDGSLGVTISLSPLVGSGFVAVVQKSASSFYQHAMLEAASRECRRIGQELHDHLCQQLLGAAFSAKALADSMARAGRGSEELQDLARMINAAVQEAREVVRGLNAGELDDRGLLPALESLTRASHRGFTCRVECPPRIRCGGPAVAPHLFRIAQEAVANARAHSGGSEVVIRLADTAECVTLSIADNGAAIPQPLPTAGIGLTLMKAHARAIGAQLIVDTRKGGGTCVSVVLAK